MGDSIFEPVIGLEIHVQLKLDSKIFCGDKNEYGNDPNTLISPVSLGYPGVLPRLNEKAVLFATRLGLALNCEIAREVTFDRKHYFYPDLPKGFQTTQERNPICAGGAIPFYIKESIHEVGLRKIHLEEDAGKSIHDMDSNYTMLDYNRAGTSLVEIVTLPEIKSPEAASSVMNEIRKLVRFLEISDGNMEEGSLRCDANISIRKKGSTGLGPKVEIKNINSMKFVHKALDYEISRQEQILLEGGNIKEETRSYDPVKNLTTSMRSKETVEDYRYFPEPDLPPYYLSEDSINDINQNLPELPINLKKKYLKFGISLNEADSLSSQKEVSDLFEILNGKTGQPQVSANWLMGPVRSYLNVNGLKLNEFPLKIDQLSDLIIAIKEEKINSNIAKKEVFPDWIKNPEKSLQEYIEKMDKGSKDIDINQLVSAVLDDFPEETKAYRSGKKKLFGFLMGEMMKRSKGRLDPKKAKEALTNQLSKG